MKSYLLNILNVRLGEGKRVALLLTMGFFMGMFLATLTVASSTLFLANFDEQEFLPKAFLLSGAIGFVATVVYNFLQNRIPFSWLAILSLVAICGLTALLEFGEYLVNNPKDLYFAGFTLIIPFSFLLQLVFWGSFGRLFNAGQSKRLLGTVDAGAMIASFIAYFSIPQILKTVETTSLYFISLVSIITFVLLFLYLSVGHINRLRTFRKEKELFKKVRLQDFLSNRYILYMSAFVVVSMIVVNFVDYSFLNVTTLMLDEKDYANFISYFEMTIVVFNFLFQTFATDRIVSVYGMRVAMLINPVMIGLFIVSAIVIGYTFGYSPDSNLFVLFFISIAMSKLIVTSLRDALDNQTFRLYLLPLESRFRIDIQTKIQGIVTAFATLAAGALIIGINAIKVFDLFSITIFTLPLVILWYFIANRMHRGYQYNLQNTLSSNKQKLDKRIEKGFTVDEVLENGLASQIQEKVIYALKLMEKLEPALFENAVVRLASSDSEKVKAFAQQKMMSLGIDSDLHKNEMIKLASRAFEDSADSDLISIQPERLAKLSKSHKRSDRVLAVKLLRGGISPKTIFVLLELLRDADPVVRYEALYTARKVKRKESWPILIDTLGSPSFSHHAAAALVAAGESVLPTLDTAFHKTGQSDIVMLRIIQIMGRIGGNYALKLLWRKADYPDKRIVKQILYSMRYVNYQAVGKESREVINLIETEIGKTIWNLAARDEIPATQEFFYLREALEEEIEENYDHIALLLSIVYDPQSVQLVRENIASGDPDSIAFALELLDLFIDPELKPKLFPLFDTTSVPEKLRQLQLFYPRESYNTIQVINYIINRDFNLNNRWTKVCAIHASAFVSDFKISRGLIAQVFNQDKLLQETAAWVIYNKDKQAYSTITERLPERDKKYLDSSIQNNKLLDGLNDGFFLNVEMIMLIKHLPFFRNIHGVLISDLADKIIPIDLREGQTVNFEAENYNKPLLINAYGEVKLVFTENTKKTLKKGDLHFGVFQDKETDPVNSIEAITRSVVFKITTMDFYFVMANHHELIEGLIKNLTEETPPVNTGA